MCACHGKRQHDWSSNTYILCVLCCLNPSCMCLLWNNVRCMPCYSFANQQVLCVALKPVPKQRTLNVLRCWYVHGKQGSVTPWSCCFACSRVCAVTCAACIVSLTQAGEEQCLLLPYHSGPLVILMVMQDIQVATEAATSSVLMQVVAGQAAALSKQLAAELPPAHMWHIQGCRYLFLDQLCGATR